MVSLSPVSASEDLGPGVIEVTGAAGPSDITATLQTTGAEACHSCWLTHTRGDRRPRQTHSRASHQYRCPRAHKQTVSHWSLVSLGAGGILNIKPLSLGSEQQNTTTGC